jgi:hypothetical protein
MNRKLVLKEGARICGLTVLALLDGGLYRVRYECCGSVDTKNYTQIVKRHNAGATLCHSCSRVLAEAEKRAAAQPAMRSLFVEDQPEAMRKRPPSAREVIAWHERATEIVRARRSV